MKTYQSTKIVQAAPITGIPPKTESRDLTHLYVATCYGPEDFAEVPVPSDIAVRYWPQLGDYLVKYADGYLSISPKQAFEEGYTEIVSEQDEAVRIAKAARALGEASYEN